MPRPIPAVRGLPDWFKALPMKAPSQPIGDDIYTMKKCPPVIDAMTYGFLMPLACDLSVHDGEFSWDRDVPSGIANYSRSPIDFHDGSQVAGTTFFDEDRFIIKFNNFWTIELPPGYSLLVTHPVNRDDLPFTTLTGLVDVDLYSLSFVAAARRGPLAKNPVMSIMITNELFIAQAGSNRSRWRGRPDPAAPRSGSPPARPPGACRA